MSLGLYPSLESIARRIAEEEGLKELAGMWGEEGLLWEEMPSFRRKPKKIVTRRREGGVGCE